MNSEIKKIEVAETYETDRLLIRVPKPGHGKILNEAIVESFEQLHLWLPWARECPTVEQSEEFCRKSYSDFIALEVFNFHFIRKEDTRFVGGLGLIPRSWEVPSFEIGYWCRSSEQGQGYTYEAVSKIVELGFDLFAAKRLQIRTDTDNESSWKLAERLGFECEGVLRNFECDNRGNARDTYYYSRIPSD